MYGIGLRIPGGHKNRQESEDWIERAITSCSTNIMHDLIEQLSHLRKDDFLCKKIFEWS